MRFMSRTFHLACALLLATAATPLHAAKADRILIVVSGEGRDQGKTRPGYEFDELSQAWLIFQANGFAIDVASPQGGAVEADRYDPQQPFNAALLADTEATRMLAATRRTDQVKAEDYAAMGGTVFYYGKPHPPIYDLARARLGLTGGRILCIGDGIATDIQGAEAQGLDALFITGGIAAAHFGPDPARPDKAALEAWLAQQRLAPRWSMPFLA